MGATDLDPVSGDLRWLADVLWPGDRARVVRRGDRGAGERWLIVPSARRPRFLIPAERKAPALASLLLYNRLRPPLTRAARRALAEALRAGVDKIVLRDVMLVEGEDAALGPALGEIFGRDDLAVAIGIPPRGPNRKPVLQVFTHAGTAVGYVKVGWNEATHARVERESRALALWEGRTARIARVPRLVHEGTWRGARISVTAPLPPDARAYPASRGLPLSALRDVLSLGSRREQSAASHADGLRARADTLENRDRARAEEVARVLDAVVRDAGHTDLPTGVGHGDWTPWNLARSRDHVYVFDWEHWSSDVPVGLDVLHWYFQIDFVVKKKSLSASFAHAVDAARTEVLALGVTPDAYELLPRLYLAEIALRAGEGVAAGAPPNPRFHEPVLELLRAASR